MPSISLCLIARNEARFLAACLASAAEVASQIIVVDTGSTDDTRAIAKRSGAEVLDFAWCDDFAKARNFGVGQAKGEWVLVLDADERLTAETAANVQRFVETSHADAGLLGMHDAARLDASEAEIVSGAARLGERMMVPRLFRNVDGLAFEGAIHEDTSAWLARRGMRLAPVGAEIVHFGRVPAIAEARQKSQRNVDLIRKWADGDRLDFAPLGYLACELLERGDRDGAKRAAEEGFRRLNAGKAPKHRAAIRLAIVRAAIQLEDGDERGAIATVSAAEAVDGPHPDFGYLRGRAAEALSLSCRGAARQRWLSQSAAAYSAALALAGVDYAQRYVPGAASWASAARLGTVKLMTGDSQAALQCFEQAKREPRAQREAELGVAEALICEHRAAEALAMIEPLLGEEPDGWLLGACAAEALGALGDALPMLEAATKRARSGYLAAHRKELHRDVIGRFSIYGAAVEASAGPGGVLAAIAASLPFFPGAELPSTAALAAVPTVVANLVRLGRGELVEPFFSARAEAAIPGCKAEALAALQCLGVEVSGDDTPEIVIVGASRASDAELLGRVLGSHPHFCAHSALGVSPSEALVSSVAACAEKGVRPLVISDDAFANAALWARLFPRARLVLMGRHGDDVALDEEVALRTTAMVRQNFLQTPVESLDSVLAFLGEPHHPGPLRSLVTSFPGAEPST